MDQERRFAIDPGVLREFLDKDYRDGYMQSQVRSGIAYQMQALRSKLGISQAAMAEKLGKPQSVVSRLENTEYGKVTVQTLLDVASALDIALLVQFVGYPEFLHRTEDRSEAALQPDTIQESVASAQRRHTRHQTGHSLGAVRSAAASSRRKVSIFAMEAHPMQTNEASSRRRIPELASTTSSDPIRFQGLTQ